MVVLITVTETNKRTGKSEQIASHGYNVDTGRTVIVPCDTPQSFGAQMHPELGWVLN